MSTAKTKKNTLEETTNEGATNPEIPMCGIIMPIAGFDGYTETHWKEVLSILKDSAAEAGFNANLVSHAEESGIIQKRIIENLYKNEMVICDISGKNANVMLELGIRLAFDKPTIVVKDDATSFSFDITPMEHIIYRRDLRFHSVLEFKSALTSKIEATHKKAQDNSLVGFIKSFGDFESIKINEKEISSQQFIIDKLHAFEQILTKPSAQIIRPKGFSGGSDTLSNNVVRVKFISIPNEFEVHGELSNLPFVHGIKILADSKDANLATSMTTYDIEFSGSDNVASIYNLVTSFTTLISGKVLR